MSQHLNIGHRHGTADDRDRRIDQYQPSVPPARLRSWIATMLSLAMVGLASAPAAANAAVTRQTAHGVGTHVLLSGDTAAASAAVDRFWTQARLKAAKSLDGTKAPGPLPTAAQMRAASAPVVRAANAPTVLPPSEGNAGVGVASTVGRVFFSDSSGALDSCSGSSVTSQAGDMVLTAGHCVFGGPQFDNSGNQPRNWYYNWIYIPAYYVFNGVGYAPFGVWSAWEIASTSGWIGSADTSQDIGMALMVHNAAGQALTTAVGGQGLPGISRSDSRSPTTATRSTRTTRRPRPACRPAAHRSTATAAPARGRTSRAAWRRPARAVARGWPSRMPGEWA